MREKKDVVLYDTKNVSLFEPLVPQIYFQQLAYLQNFVLIHIDKPHLSTPPPSSFHIFYFVFSFLLINIQPLFCDEHFVDTQFLKISNCEIAEDKHFLKIEFLKILQPPLANILFSTRYSFIQKYFVFSIQAVLQMGPW